MPDSLSRSPIIAVDLDLTGQSQINILAYTLQIDAGCGGGPTRNGVDISSPASGHPGAEVLLPEIPATPYEVLVSRPDADTLAVFLTGSADYFIAEILGRLYRPQLRCTRADSSSSPSQRRRLRFALSGCCAACGFSSSQTRCWRLSARVSSRARTRRRCWTTTRQCMASIIEVLKAGIADDEGLARWAL
jgi:hypothetical protein